MRNETILPSLPHSHDHGDAPGLLSRAVDELIFWSVAVAFSPWILRERFRRRRQLRTASVQTDPAVDALLHNLSATVEQANQSAPRRHRVRLVID